MKRERLTLKLSELKPNPDNPRTITKQQLNKLVDSVKSYPEMLEIRPIVVDEDNIILGGNMRYRALEAVGGNPDVAVERVTGLTPEQKREFIIKDNVAFGQWDWDELANKWDADELGEWGLVTDSFNIDDLGKTSRKELKDVPTIVVCPKCNHEFEV